MSEPLDAIVIGAGPSGLTAAAYLAGAGRRTLVVEAEAAPGGSSANALSIGGLSVPRGAHTLAALDPRVVKELKLLRRGLKFAARDLALVALRSEAKPLVLGRDPHAAARSIAAPRDAQRFVQFRHEMFAFARAMRAAWWEDGAPGETAELHRLSMTSAAAYLDASFESETLKAAFAFDAMAGGMSPFDAGSALLFAWRAAQEMCGLQGAVAVPKGGAAALVNVLLATAEGAGAQIRTGAKAARLTLSGNAVSGVVLETGETIAASLVLSSLSRRETLLGLAPTGAAGFAAAAKLAREAPKSGEGKLVAVLNAVPGFAALQPSARFILAERLDGELALEAIVPSAFDASLAPAGKHLLSVLIRPLPVSPEEGWAARTPKLTARVLAALERHAPGLKAAIVAQEFVPPPGGRDPQDAARLTASWRARIATPLEGLFLCGPDAEPVASVSCRAARIAAGIGLKGGAP